MVSSTFTGLIKALKKNLEQRVEADDYAWEDGRLFVKTPAGWVQLKKADADANDLVPILAEAFKIHLAIAGATVPPEVSQIVAQCNELQAQAMALGWRIGSRRKSDE